MKAAAASVLASPRGPQGTGPMKSTMPTAGAATVLPPMLAGLSDSNNRTQGRDNKTMLKGRIETVFDECKAATEQSQKMSSLSAGVQRMSSIFEQAAKAREEQRRMMDDLYHHTMQKVEATWREMERIMSELSGNMNGFMNKFEKQLEETKEELSAEQKVKVAEMIAHIESLEVRSRNLKQALDEERQARIRETEAVLGPIRKQVKKITESLEKEERIHLTRTEELKKQEAEAVEALDRGCKLEVQNRERKAKELFEDTEAEQDRLRARQGKIERSSHSKLKNLDKSLASEKHHRTTSQDHIVERVTDFIRRFQTNVKEEGEMG